MSITLAKSSDYVNGYTEVPYLSRQWTNTLNLWSDLTTTHGPETGNRLYEGLCDNNPEAFAETLPALSNVPDHKGTTTTNATPIDYSDGYGTEYAVGE